MSVSLRNVFDSTPRRVTVVDVSARDGLQSQDAVLPSGARAEWIRALLEAGVPQVEAGSFVDPRRVPQMAETEAVLNRLLPFRDCLWVLVPNARGLEEAVRAGARNVVCLVSATETHSRANLARPICKVLDDLERLRDRIDRAGLGARAAVSMAWIDPTEGIVPSARVLEICRNLRDMGFREITLCDTYGGASPKAVAELLEDLLPVYPPEAVGLHFHDTFGMASANVLVGLLEGVTRFDASIGGLGGCPFAPGARGNMDTGHLVRMLDALGVTTGIDLSALESAAGACIDTLLTASARAPGNRDRND